MQQELLKKLRYKAGGATVINSPDGFDLGLEAAPNHNPNDFVLLFVNHAAELNERLPKAITILNDDALFWIAYPKQSSKVKSDLNRDILAKLVNETTPYRPVSNVAIDDPWSALRFRHQDKVKTSK